MLKTYGRTDVRSYNAVSMSRHSDAETKKKLGERKKRERERGRERKKTKKKQNETKKTKQNKKQPTASHPSVKGQRPQERWIGATGNYRRRTLAQNRPFGFVRITGYRRSGCRRGRQEWIYVRSGPNPDSITREANVQNPSLRTRHLDFPPKPCSNSIFKPQCSRLERVARASGSNVFGSKFTNNR